MSEEAAMRRAMVLQPSLRAATSISPEPQPSSKVLSSVRVRVRVRVRLRVRVSVSTLSSAGRAGPQQACRALSPGEGQG